MSTEHKVVTRTIIPAQPNWNVAYFMPATESKPDHFLFDPIVGWLVTTIFTEGERDDGETCVYLSRL
jgi:hypothetical protein